VVHAKIKIKKQCTSFAFTEAIAKTALPKKTRSVCFQVSDFIYNFQKGLTITFWLLLFGGDFTQAVSSKHNRLN